MSNQFIIETNTIRLRAFSKIDYHGLYGLTRQSEITDMLPDWNMTEEQLEGFLEFVIASYESFDSKDVRILLAVEHKQDKKLIGWCGVFPNNLLDPAAREIAYAISKDYRNQGYTTSAVRAMISFIFSNTWLDQIVAIVKPHNHASRRVLEKAGLSHIHLTKLSDQEEYDYFEVKRNGVYDTETGPIIRRANVDDAEALAEMMKRTFDQEIKKWHTGEESPDNNLCPPAYDSVEMHKYLIRESCYYVIVLEGKRVGGVSVNYLGKRHARLDKIFIDPNFQGQGIGSKVISLLEKEFPFVEVWKLETSSKQISNHYFYEKMGFIRSYESEWEYGYEKINSIASRTKTEEIRTIEMAQSRIENQNLSNVEFTNCSMNETDFYKVNLKNGCYSDSNLQGSQVTDCNLSYSKFTNLNLTNVLLADLRLSNSEIELVSLDGVYFHDTNLGSEKKPILFERCDLSGSEIRSSDLSNVNINQCKMSGMKINNIPVEELLKSYYRSSEA
ncbi:Protein N-acetyltransferase, RimJ/RimL family [Paenibacillaceae bacterium GAS479]|nr:Protein N-acetyltransferase, RimJ/RimL family [Paenibacillaceae bacterium GAS479]